MKKRTNIDFSKHELIIKKDSLCKIHWLKKPDTIIHNVKFIHVEGILVVTGDFGRWSFDRDFNPEGFEVSGVSDAYWCEKIESSSKQQTNVFDAQTAEESIQEKINELLEYAEYDENSEPCFKTGEKEQEFEFWNDLLSYCDDEFELVVYFRDNKPKSLDYEDFPVCKKINPWLDVIFDAFEEIISRLNKNSNGN